jgi:hypothetical protein
MIINIEKVRNSAVTRIKIQNPRESKLSGIFLVPGVRMLSQFDGGYGRTQETEVEKTPTFH